jgi:tetratricopeptide (TPR) repeat protein
LAAVSWGGRHRANVHRGREAAKLAVPFYVNRAGGAGSGARFLFSARVHFVSLWDKEQSRTRANEYAASARTKVNDRQYDEALKDLNKAIRLDPSNALCHDERGNAYTYLGFYGPAIQDYNRAIKLSAG